jgi:hypothetical protein
MLLNWEDRPFEIAYGLNPAFLAILLHQAILSFERKDSQGMSYPLLMLVVPIIFYAPIRNRLPKDENSDMSQWVKDNPEVVLNFPNRVNQLIPYSKEAIIFAMQQDIIKISSEGNFLAQKKQLYIDKNLQWNFSPNSRTYQMKTKAQFLGKWFAMSGSTEAIYRTLGIKP